MRALELIIIKRAIDDLSLAVSTLVVKVVCWAKSL
jgi:hypothetical protein